MTRLGILLAFLFFAPGAFAARTHEMASGDTLYALAQSEYSDPLYWRELKAYNGIQNVYSIPVGTQIVLPDKATLDQVRQAASTPGGDVGGTVTSLGGNPAPKTTFASEALGGKLISTDYLTGLGSPGTIPEGMSDP